MYGKGGPLIEQWYRSGSILVAYATRSGSTQEVAEQIAATLRESGLEVSVQPARQVADAGRLQRRGPGSAPLYRALAQGRAALFEAAQGGPLEPAGGPFCARTAGRHGGASRKARATNSTSNWPKFPWLTPVEIELFGGAFNPAKLGFPFNVLPAMKDQPASDIRDWDAIRAWASGLAAKL